ncbi:MAG: tRNA 2-thiocytidine(32) synthetase TtcA, partial [Proteobacteria bacterium]|nr:tRNA 2-thiocytidine(32) synthetase TtcA [Pseudomonadota bacterium]
LSRVRVKKLIDELAQENPKVPSNILHALSSIQPSHLMDQSLWDFNEFRQIISSDNSTYTVSS